ncbi:MFS transporter [Halalkalibacillus halophilus]|uniref:MFS transporter n=1 Tax=Halalkalibacillus halophilus TaxID=392827 RepID=UPI001FE06BDA|nr:MFS transporter [Halalkalibacillus halophilus]
MMKFSRLVLPGIMMIAVTYGLARFSFGLLLLDINQSLHMSEFISGLVSSLFYLAYCVTIVVSTVVTAREGPRKMIIFAGVSALIGLLLMASSPNAWVLALGVLFAGGSAGLISPPYGAAISLWIKEKVQGKANSWINSGTSIGIALSGVGAILLAPNWRFTYSIYAVLTLFILLWNYKVIPKMNSDTKLMFNQGRLTIRGVPGSVPVILASLMVGISSAGFWTFSRSYIEIAGVYSDWILSGFWVVIGVFGVLGGFSGFLIDKFGVSTSYRLGGLAIASASILLAVAPENMWLSYLSAGLFGSSYIFLSGVLIIWGIRIFIVNASLGIGVPFLLMSLGQIIGSLIAGLMIGLLGYATTFVVFGIIGLMAIVKGPRM